MISTVLVAALLSGTGPAASSPAHHSQDKAYGVYGQVVEERASTRIGYWFRNVNAGLGEVVVSYGRPLWKAEYEEKFDAMTEGKMWRMGDNYWSIFDTQLPVTLGGVKIDPGLYYLAIRRSQDGAQWELVFIDHEEARRKLLDSYDVRTRPAEIPILFTVPLEFEKTQTPVEKMTVLFELEKPSKDRGFMRLTWGSFALSAPILVEVTP
ncbi:MAG TPA: DUF2911 domain-containing protein [Acidobacteriota bacterium]|nr:DUF2911 domain-containing protein [Acidobacteriota bacterium]